MPKRRHPISCQCPFCKAKRGTNVPWNKGLTVKMDKRVVNRNKGKTYEEIYGKERAKEIGQKISKRAKLRVGELNSFYGKHHSEESKRKFGRNISRASKGKSKQKMGHNIKTCQCAACKAKRGEKRVCTENCQCAICKAKRGETKGENNSMYGRTVASGKNPMCRPEVREKQLKKMRSPGFREAQSKRFKGKNNPMYGKNAWDFMDKETKKRRRTELSKMMSGMWQDSEYVEKQKEARNIKPNKAELKLNDFLQKILPNEYKYVGDFSFFIAGKCPDFINTNDQKKIIELFGDYYHKGDDGKDRMRLFKKYGYQTLIIWEHELNNAEELKDKVSNFQLQ